MALEELTQAATRAAYQAGNVLKDHFGKLIRVSKKGALDLVTEADIASETTILGVLSKAFPNHSILSEESGAVSQIKSDHQWIIDPLDGTTNFVHDLPIFAVSIAHAYQGHIDLGIVFNPINGEFFSAKLGDGAALNGHPLSVTTTNNLEDSLLVTGFPYNVRTRSEPLMRRFHQCLLAAQGIRRLGSAALDLCYVACGRFDGFWEESLKSWDTAAGSLIVQEAGGMVTTFNGQEYQPGDPEILATNRIIHSDLVRLLR